MLINIHHRLHSNAGQWTQWAALRRNTNFFSYLLSVPLLYHSMGQIIKSVFFVCVCVYVCMYDVCVCLWARLRSHFSTDLHEIWYEPLGSESEELIRLGSKSENAFPYFSPKNQNFWCVNRHFKPNLQKFQIVISSKLYIGLA